MAIWYGFQSASSKKKKEKNNKKKLICTDAVTEQ